MQGNQIKAAILGGGPAGILAALQIRHTADCDVHLFDANPKVGRKLAVTGSGRCNITNQQVAAEKYFCSEGLSVQSVLDRYPRERIQARLAELGIPIRFMEDGWAYPLSYSAANVAEILRGQLLAAGVHLVEDTKVLSITRNGAAFELRTDTSPERFTFDQVIVATGSKAFPQLRADAGIVQSFAAMGLRFNPFLPALAPVSLDNREIKALEGIRMDAGLTLFREHQEVARSFGNLIFTSYGVNGPGCMNLSHWITPPEKTPQFLRFNFLPSETAKIITANYYQNNRLPLPYANLYLAALSAKLVMFFLKRWKLSVHTAITEIEPKTFNRHLKDLQQFDRTITAVHGFKEAQVCSGGLSLNEINLETLETKKVRGLYFAGEILDVIGPCGGYNLHWALSTGMLAAESLVNSNGSALR